MGHLECVRRISAVGLGLLLVAAAVAQEEDFDQDGADWSVTIFADIIASGGGSIERAALGEGHGAPNTLPPLPINQGGDKEGRYFEASQAPSYSVALSDPASWAFRLDGYVGIGNADSSASQAVGFLLSASADSTIESLNAYVALISHESGSNTATLSIRRIRDGILGGGPDTLATSIPFEVDFGSENYRLTFNVEFGDNQTLFARLHRAAVVNGANVLTRVDLLDDPGVQHVLSVADDGLQVGDRAGVLAFARGTSSIFFEELSRCGDPCNINGDTNCNAFQIEPFLELLFNGKPGGHPCAGDFDGNGRVDAFDIEPFLEALFRP